MKTCAKNKILNVKEKIKAAKGHAVEHQKIIFSGKVLADERTVEQCNIKEKDFLVSMVSKVSSLQPFPCLLPTK